MGEEKFYIVCCSNFKKEVERSVSKLHLSEVEILCYPGICTSKKRKEFTPEIKDLYKQGAKIETIGCLNKKYVPGETDTSYEAEEFSRTCFDFVLQPLLVHHLLSEGNYLITPGWLARWEYFVKDLWKFNREQARRFFRESASSLLVLDTLGEPETSKQIEEFAAFTDLPCSSLKIGTKYLEQHILLKYRAWQNELLIKSNKDQEIAFNKEKSHYIFALDAIKNIKESSNKEAIVAYFTDLFRLIFAPQEIKFLHATAMTDQNMLHQKESYWLHNKHDGFSIKIMAEDKTEGLFIISKIKFPEKINNYLNMALHIANVIGLSLRNASLIERLNKNILELEQAKSKAEIANDAKNQLFSIVAHDLRSPMANIAAYVDFLNADYDSFSKKEVHNIIDNIDQSAQRLMELMTNLLNWAKTQLNQLSTNPELIDIKEIIHTEMGQLKAIANNKNISFEIKECENTTCFIDKDMIQGVFRNITGNAIKFSNKNSKIHVECYPDESYLVIAVRDHGVGMTEEQQKKLFNSILSTPGTNNEKGTGLGLVSSKKLVEKNNGKLMFESKKNEGSLFMIYLPKEQTHENSND